MNTHDNRTPMHADLTDREIEQQSSLMDCGQWGECDHNRGTDDNPTCLRRAVGWMRDPENRDEVIELCDYHAGVDLSDHLRPNTRFERDKCDAEGCSARWTDHRGWLHFCEVHAAAFDLECDDEGITRHRLSPPPNPVGPQGAG